MGNYDIAVLEGDGIGPEIMTEGLKVLDAVGEKYGHTFNWRKALIGGAAYDDGGHPFPDETAKICEDSAAIYFGSVGGPKWENLPSELTPEKGALLPLRKRYDLFANLRPAMIFGPLSSAASLKEDRLGEGLDLLVVRELTGGIYFGNSKVKSITLENDGREYVIPAGEAKIDGRRVATDLMIYSEDEIERITRVAGDAAMKRAGHLTSIDKANVLETSVLWRDVVSNVIESDYPEVRLDHQYVDNAAMQVATRPTQYDVIVTGNMFGDIISDLSSAITGSIGMLPSASLNSKGFGLYEPVGGSAPDIAGQNKANPLAQILSGAMMLRHSFGLIEEAKDIEEAISEVLDADFRTADIAGVGTIDEESARHKVATTREMGDMVRNVVQGKEMFWR